MSDFYQSKKWICLRKWAISFYGRKCLKCGSTEKIHVDHIIARCRSYWLRLSKRNVQPLCERCNLEKGVITADYRPYHKRVLLFLELDMRNIVIAFIAGFISRYYTEAYTLTMIIAEVQYYLSELNAWLMVGG